MEKLQILAFFSVFVFLYLGFFVLRLDYGSKLNRVFFYLCISLTLYISFYIVTYLSDDRNFILHYARVAGIGWHSFSALFLHFALIVTGEERRFPKKILHAFLYSLPAVLIIRENISLVTIRDIILVEGVWREVLYSDSPWFWIWIAYMLLFGGIAFIIIARWGLRSSFKRVKIQSSIMFIFGVIGLTVTLITDILLPYFEIFTFPITSYITLLIFMLGLWIAVRKYRLMNLDPSSVIETIVTNMMDLLIIIDTDGRIRAVNRQVMEILGYKEQQLLGLSLQKIIRDFAEFQKQYFTIVKNKSNTVNLETSLLTHKRKEIPFKLRITGIMDQFGDFLGYVLIGEDLSETKLLRKISGEKEQAEKALMESEIKFRQITESMMESITLLDLEGKYQYVSPSSKKFYGHRPETMLGKYAFDYMYPDDAENAKSLFQKLIDSKKSRSVEFRWRTVEGSYKWIESAATIIEDEHGNVKNVVVASRDIDEKKRALKALEDSEEKFRRITTSMVDIIFQIDTSGFIEYTSPSVGPILGLFPDDFTGRNILDIVYPEDRRNIKQTVIEGMQKGQVMQTEVRAVHKNGTVYWFDCLANFIMDDEGKPSNIVVSGRDITDKKKIEAKLLESENSLRQRNQIIENDISNAKMIQDILLPRSIPSCSYLEISHKYLPAEAIGGDYFSYTSLAEGGYGLFVGDVSGHGVSAALFLSLLKTTTDKICRQYGQKPGMFLEKLNNELEENMPHSFITAVYAFFHEPDSNGRVKVFFASGGHPSPVLFKAKEKKAHVLKSIGTLLGAFPDLKFEENTVLLQRGDILFFYTDGLPETMNEDNEMYGYENIRALTQRACRQGDIDEVDYILKIVDEYRGNGIVDDDTVVICVKVK